jgi:hypothetical protein
MQQQLKPLGTVMQLLEELGHEVTYAYEDLVFVNHNDFLLQFDTTGSSLGLFFNKTCPVDDADNIEQSIIPAADRKGLSITRKGRYLISDIEDENLQIAFYET